LAAIREAFTRDVARYERAQGFEVPMPALIASGRRP
jgi:hypothetical protein